MGLSLGGQSALNAAFLAPDRLAGLWLDGVTSQRMEDFPEAENFGERFANLINGLILKMAELRLGRAAPPPLVEILPTLERPQIVLVGAGLDPFEERITRRVARVVESKAQEWLIADASHIGSPLVRPDDNSWRMLAVFEVTLDC